MKAGSNLLMINYQAEVNWISNQLTSIASSNSSIAANTSSISASLENMNSQFQDFGNVLASGFENISDGLNEVSYQIDNLIDEFKNFGVQQFIQNKERNDLLASIDSSLKAPNKTAAQERFDIGIELATRGKLEHAIKMLKEAIDLNPLHFQAHIQLASYSLLNNNFDEALQFAKEGISLAPENQDEILAYNYYLVARAYDKLHNWEQAVVHIKKALEYYLRPEYRYELATYYAKLNNAEEAMQALGQAISIDHEFKYFAQSIVDPVFHKFHKERESMLEGYLNSQKDKIGSLLGQLDNLRLPAYNVSENQGLRFDPMNLPTNSFYYDGRYQVEHVMSYVAIPGVYKEDNPIPYSYNQFIQAFNKYCQDLNHFYQNKVNQIKNQAEQGSFAAYSQAINSVNEFKNEYNQLVNAVNSFANRFYSHKENFSRFLENEMEATQNLIKENQRELKESKQGMGFFGLFDKDERDHLKDLKEDIADYYNEIEKIKQARIEVQREQDEIDRVRALMAAQPLVTL